MSKKLYEENDVQAIADAIRAKNGGTDTYKLSEMAQAVTDIPSGGGDIDGFVDGTVTSIESDAEKVVQYACYVLASLTSVSLPNAISIGRSAFYGCNALTSVSLPKATSIEQSAFYNCTALTSVSIPNVTSISLYAFQKCSALTSISLPKIGSISMSAFQNSSLNTLILRHTKVCVLSNVNALYSTPIKSGRGYVYVPDDLVDSYKAATNWSTYAAQIKPLSEYVEE